MRTRITVSLPSPLAVQIRTLLSCHPEASSVVACAAGQLVGGSFVIVMTALRGQFGKLPTYDQPAGTMIRALTLQAAFCVAVLPAGMLLGVGVGAEQRTGRLVKENERALAQVVSAETEVS